ncbi:HIRAN domain-containing protein [Amniculibacterium aquaticum]|uniref:HIRAN domain-containing protein n=1 Tax=Amniculibacterium aquaticum TaxID=2479858 RepID=UPI000F59E5B6|nr:HIRAN domain-containing protein [Amniculibacterium aquaticum]
MKKEHLSHFNIAGFTYYDGALVFQKLNIGTKLNLVLEPDNKYDARAIAIYYKDHKIGFVPRTENRILYKLLMVGLKRNLQVVIQRVSKNEHPENQIQVVVHLIS